MVVGEGGVLHVRGERGGGLGLRVGELPLRGVHQPRHLRICFTDIYFQSDLFPPVTSPWLVLSENLSSLVALPSIELYPVTNPMINIFKF